MEAKANSEILPYTEVRCMEGGTHLQVVHLENMQTGETRRVETRAVFCLIGAWPRTDGLPAEIERDEKGFIQTGRDVFDSPYWTDPHRQPRSQETSRPGVFAAGDVRRGSVKRVAAVGDGCDGRRVRPRCARHVHLRPGDESPAEDAINCQTASVGRVAALGFRVAGRARAAPVPRHVTPRPDRRNTL